jgi:ketosteroid isomerase-like protein
VAAGVVIAMALLLYTTSRREDVLAERPSAGSAAVAVAPAPGRPAARPTEPAAPSPAPVVAAAPSAAVAAVPPAGPEARQGPLSALEATALVDEFRAAYEARDVERLVALFAEDAIENGREGREAIAAAYRSTLPALAQVGYGIARLAVEPRGSRAEVRAPFVLRYTHPGGEVHELHGEAEWALERREGRPQIVVLNYRLDPTEPAR